MSLGQGSGTDGEAPTYCHNRYSCQGPYWRDGGRERERGGVERERERERETETEREGERERGVERKRERERVSECVWYVVYGIYGACVCVRCKTHALRCEGEIV